MFGRMGCSRVVQVREPEVDGLPLLGELAATVLELLHLGAWRKHALSARLFLLGAWRKHVLSARLFLPDGNFLCLMAALVLFKWRVV